VLSVLGAVRRTQSKQRIHDVARRAKLLLSRWRTPISATGLAGFVTTVVTALNPWGNVAFGVVFSIVFVLAVLGWTVHLRRWSRSEVEPGPEAAGVSLAEIFRACADRARQELVALNGVGWGRLLRHPDGPVPAATALSSAYGLKLAYVIGAQLPRSQAEKVANAILGTRSKSNSLWAARTHHTESIEVSATVLAAVVSVIGKRRSAETLTAILAHRELLYLSESVIPVYSLATTINGLVAVKPEHPLLRDLVGALVQQARDDSGGLSWPDTKGHLSLAHTAWAVTALNRISRQTNELRVYSSGGRSNVDALDLGTRRLANATWNEIEQNRTEVIERERGSATDSLVVHHYTRALVLRALVETGSAEDRYSDIAGLIVRDYKDGAFEWGDGETPLWLTYQACLALRLTAVAQRRFTPFATEAKR
jgi:hypothetical protein